jgi:hypothetical protein
MYVPFFLAPGKPLKLSTDLQLPSPPVQMIIDYTRSKPLRPSNILDPLIQPDRTIFPFHIEHKASAKGYSLYVENDKEGKEGNPSRKEWLAAIKDQIMVRNVANESGAVRFPSFLPSFVLPLLNSASLLWLAIRDELCSFLPTLITPLLNVDNLPCSLENSVSSQPAS